VGRLGVGDSVVHEVVVTNEMTARLFDREYHPVYATYWMARHIEEAGRLLVEPHLGPDEDAVGFELSMRHERPARIGDRLELRARVSEVDPFRCVAEVEVSGPSGLVGRATFVQRFVRKDWLAPKGTEERAWPSS
jgi:fluoroacetyl-CoA thioesterase